MVENAASFDYYKVVHRGLWIQFLSLVLIAYISPKFYCNNSYKVIVINWIFLVLYNWRFMEGYLYFKSNFNYYVVYIILSSTCTSFLRVDSETSLWLCVTCLWHLSEWWHDEGVPIISCDPGVVMCFTGMSQCQNTGQLIQVEFMKNIWL